MKMIHLIAVSAVVQLIIVVYLVTSVVNLESQLSMMVNIFNESRSHSGISSSVDKYASNNSNLACEHANQALKNELKEEFFALIKTLKKDIATTDHSVELAVSAPNLSKVENINSEIDYFLNDGELSSIELNEIELKLMPMNYQERQLVLQKVAKAMTKANVILAK
tara:strand:- start:3303 stop:3800 length:498 start_codon:yes stop_codon:yes gene_type:complete